MSRTSLVTLDKRQQAAFSTHAERWQAARRSTAAADRSAAEAAVHKAYAAAQLPAPDAVVWCRSPVELARSWRGALYTTAPGTSVKRQVIDGVRRRIEGRLERLIDRTLYHSILIDPRLARQPFSTFVFETGFNSGEFARPQFRQRLAAWRPRQWFSQERRVRFGSVAHCFHSGHTEAHFQLFRDDCDLADVVAPLDGYLTLAQEVEWMLPYENTCWLGERPEKISCDLMRRAHCADGPALAYRDGWSVFAWKGSQIPPQLILERDAITVTRIDRTADPLIRRCMIDIMTPERFIGQGGARCVAQDSFGKLWRRGWHWDAWQAVEVVNGTEEPDGSHKTYFLQVPPNLESPRQAVAWTYGLSAEQYSPVLRT